MREDFRRMQGDNPRNGAFVVRFFGDSENADHIGLTKSLVHLYSQVIDNAR
jgi:hypothetical protein